LIGTHARTNALFFFCIAHHSFIHHPPHDPVGQTTPHPNHHPIARATWKRPIVIIISPNQNHTAASPRIRASQTSFFIRSIDLTFILFYFIFYDLFIRHLDAKEERSYPPSEIVTVDDTSRLCQGLLPPLLRDTVIDHYAVIVRRRLRTLQSILVFAARWL
jgi:hypothetical protein